MYVCVCRGVTDSQIQQAVVEGDSSVRELKMRLGLGSDCGKCVTMARSIIDESLATLEVGKNNMFYCAS